MAARKPNLEVVAPTARVLPWSQEAEMSVLGGILLDSGAYARVADLVRPDDFYHPAHGAIFQAMVDCDSVSKPIDAITVAEQMRASDTLHRLRAFNGESYFAELTSAVVTVENIAFHAKIVRGKATVRRVIETSQRIAALGYGDYGDAEDYLLRAQEDIYAVAMRDAAARLVTQEESLREAIKKVEANYTQRLSGGPPPGIPTGFDAIDQQLAGGWQPEFILVGGRPSSGKTSFVMDFVEYAGLCGIPVLVISTEMRHAALTLRRLSSAALVDGWKLRGGVLEANELMALTKAGGELSRAKIHYLDSAHDLPTIRAVAKRWRANPEMGGFLVDGKRTRAMIVVDYLQEIQPHTDGDERGRGRSVNREEEIRQIGAGLKRIVNDLDVTVVAVASLNRELEKRDDKRPRNSDLRESGALEFQADIIAFVYRDVVYNPKADKRAAEIIFTKARNLKVGMVPLDWYEEITSFRNAQAQPELPVSPPSSSPQRPPRRRRAHNPHSEGGED